MKSFTSKIGWALALIYIATSIFLIMSQGLFGESFIALILGLPWSMIFAFFEYGGVSGVTLYLLLIGPIVFNAALLYWIGSLLDKKRVTV